MRIGIAGIGGRMGQAVAAAIAADPTLTLAGGIGRSGTDQPVAPAIPADPTRPHADGLGRSGGAGQGRLADIAALAAVSDVVIDVTHASAIPPHAAALAAAGVPWVLGTTGADAAARAAIHQAARSIAVLEAANFSIGLNLLLALAERLGAALPAAAYDAEILEMHHAAKRDAPSGTALALGQAVARGRGVALDGTARYTRHGQVGPRPKGEIGFAALRGGGVVGDHSVIFTSGAEQITLAHRALSRAVFAEGALRAAQWLVGRPPGHYSMRHLLAGTDPLPREQPRA